MRLMASKAEQNVTRSDYLLEVEALAVELHACPRSRCQADPKSPCVFPDGHPFWYHGSLSVLRYDLDGDGLDDVVVSIVHPAYCDDTGCYARILFGSPDHSSRPRGFGFISDRPIRLETRRGEPGLVYGPNERFRPMWDVKQLAQ